MPPVIEPDKMVQAGRTQVLLKGKKLTFFAGCDYYRLSSHPRVAAALKRGLGEHGLSVAASRLTTGNHPLYGEVERAIAEFFQVQKATIVSTGYLADLVAAEALAGEFSHVLLDSAAHPALRNAANLFNCPTMMFASRQPVELARAAERCGPEARPIVLTEGMFSRDGSVAPLKDYLRVLPRRAMILVDDAHGAGVVGESGRGSVEECGVKSSRKRIIQTITLSKAFGVFGGAILGDGRLREKILRRSGMFIGSTPPPLPLMAAVLASVSLLAQTPRLRAKMRTNIAWLRSKLNASGFDVPTHPGPIVNLTPKDARISDRVSRALLKAGIFPSLSRYAGTPKGGYFRFVVSSEHTPEQLEQLGVVLSSFSPAELFAPSP